MSSVYQRVEISDKLSDLFNRWPPEYVPFCNNTRVSSKSKYYCMFQLQIFFFLDKWFN